MKLFKPIRHQYLIAFLVVLISWSSIYLLLDYFALWSFWGVQEMIIRFPDLHVLLSAIDGHHAGIDVMKQNPLCVLKIPHVYSRAWFHLHYLGFSDANRIFIGILAILSFAASSAWLIKDHLLKSLLFLCSSALLLTIERCNNDLFIFLLLFFAGVLVTRKGTWCLFACHIIILIATTLKYYPVAFSLIFLFRGKGFVRNFKHVVVQTIFFLAWILYIKDDLILQESIIPDPGYAWSFGINPFISLVNNFLNINSIFSVPLIFLLSSVFIFLSTRIYLISSWDFSNLSTSCSHVIFLIGGTMVLLFCYIVRTNFDHRMLFFIFCIPALLKVKLQGSEKKHSLMYHPFLIFLLFVASSWFEGIRQWLNILLQSVNFNEFIPHTLFAVRASEIIINHVAFMLLLAFSISLICRHQLNQASLKQS